MINACSVEGGVPLSGGPLYHPRYCRKPAAGGSFLSSLLVPWVARARRQAASHAISRHEVCGGWPVLRYPPELQHAMALSIPGDGCQDHTLTEASVMASQVGTGSDIAPSNLAPVYPSFGCAALAKLGGGGRVSAGAINKCRLALVGVSTPKSKPGGHEVPKARACGAALPIGDRYLKYAV